MKYIIFSDLHLGWSSSSDVWLEASKNLILEIIKKAREEDIDNVLFLGDFFNDRRSLSLKTLWMATEIANIIEDSKIHFHLILGNHDLYLKNSLYPHSLKMFEKFEYIHIVDKILELNSYVTLVPWSLWKNPTTPYVFGHFEINGFDIECSNNKFEFNISDFKKFTHVFSGHFHNPKKISNVFYIGSCMPFTFHDVDSKRGFYIIDIHNDKDFDLEFIEFDKSPKFKILYSSDEINEEDIRGNVVKLVYMKELSSIENEKLLEKISHLNPVILQTDFNNISTTFEEIIEQNEVEIKTYKNAIELLYEYTNKLTPPEHIKLEILNKFIDMLVTSDE